MTFDVPYIEKPVYDTKSVPFKVFRENNAPIIKYLLPHWHEEFEINYILSGSVTYFLNSEKKVVNDGEIIIINCNCVHSADYSDENLKYITLLFNLSMLQTTTLDAVDTKYIKPIIDDYAIIDNVIVKETPCRDNLVNIILDCYKLIINKDVSYELRLKSNLLLLLSILYENNIISTKNNQFNNNKHLDDIKIVLTYIENNYFDKLYLDELSALINYNKDYFARIFKKCVGVSCFTYITTIRIKKAEFLLNNTDMSITEVCQEVGYESQSYFIQKFKEINKVSPKQYRKKGRL